MTYGDCEVYVAELVMDTGRLHSNSTTPWVHLSTCSVVSRVPTKANWADKPSRLDFSQLLSLGAKLEEVHSPEIGQLSGVDVGQALSWAIKSRRN